MKTSAAIWILNHSHSSMLLLPPSPLQPLSHPLPHNYIPHSILCPELCIETLSLFLTLPPLPLEFCNIYFATRFRPLTAFVYCLLVSKTIIHITEPGIANGNKKRKFPGGSRGSNPPPPPYTGKFWKSRLKFVQFVAFWRQIWRNLAH